MSEPQSEPAVIYFTAPWCAPCKKYLPIVLSEAAKAGVEVQLIDIDTPEGGAMAAEHLVQMVPTLAFVSRGGKDVKYYQGPHTPKWVRDAIADWKEAVS